MVDQITAKRDRPHSSRSSVLHSNHEDSKEKSQFISDDEKLLWLALQKTEKNAVRTPSDLEDELVDPPMENIDEKILDRVQGSICGLAIGDALGAHVEFRPRSYLEEHPVQDIEGGGTWGLDKGKWTDDTSMALCLGNSLIHCQDFIPYDQLVRYKWWFREGYMSSTGNCFDIGAATSMSLQEFERRQNEFRKKNQRTIEKKEEYLDDDLMKKFDVYCSAAEVAGNGGLMRLAPVPLFFYRNIFLAIEFSGRSTEITHGDPRARDAARYYGALIAAILRDFKKEDILHPAFYRKHRQWFGDEPLHPDIVEVIESVYLKTGGYDDGIRGKGFVVPALEAALWAFRTTNTFKDGALAAVNLGDDTDTTAAIYGQLAGAYYGYKGLPQEWIKVLYAKKYLLTLSKWIVYQGDRWEQDNRKEFERLKNKGSM